MGDDQTPRPVFHEVLRAGMEHGHVSLSALRERLADRGHRVSLSTLSYWRSGQRRPEKAASLDAVSEIETILNLPTNALSGSLGPSRRPGPAPAETPMSELADFSTDLRDLLPRVGVDPRHCRLRELDVHLVVDVDADGNDVRATARMVVRATADGVTSYPIVIGGLAGGERARVEWVRGVTSAAHHDDEAAGLQLWRLDFDRPLRTGEVRTFEFALALPTTVHTYSEYYAERALRELMIWVRFDAGRIPAAVEIYDSNQPGADSAVDLDGSASVTALFHGYGPGTAGLRWHW